MFYKKKWNINQNSKISAQERGIQAEELVKKYFLNRNYQVLYHRKKFFGVEFDWIFQGNEELIFVEVKSIRSAEFYLHRWPLKQRRRFIKVADVLSSKQKSKFFLAFVNYQDQIQFFRVGSEIERV